MNRDAVPHPSAGFSLIEALVALAVLSIGMLGVAAMQLKAVQGAHAAYQHSIATLAAQDAQERLWAKMAEEGGLTCPGPGEVNGTYGGSWHAQWSTFLPGLNSSPVSGGSDCKFTIEVAWNEERFRGDSDETTESFSYTVRLPGGW